MTSRRTNGQNRHLWWLRKTSQATSIFAALLLALACTGSSPKGQTSEPRDLFPTPDRSQVQIIDDDVPAGLTDADAISAYQQGYAHMRAAAWFSAIAAYDETIRIQPAVSGLYEARGTAHMYAGRHDEALADYSHGIELNPNDAGQRRRRAYAFTVAPTPEPYKGVEDATRAIRPDSAHPVRYSHGSAFQQSVSMLASKSFARFMSGPVQTLPMPNIEDGCQPAKLSNLLGC